MAKIQNTNLTEMNSQKLNILTIIHGFPPYYMAGSEVYTYNLNKELSHRHKITVFTRIVNNYRPYYTVEKSTEEGMDIIRVNKPERDYTYRSKHSDPKLDKIFKKYLKEVNPDIVHFGHLSHLSTNLVNICKQEGYPVIFTLHDYWLMCTRGQLITPEMELCSGPSAEKCYECNKQYFLTKEEGLSEIQLWLDTMKPVIDNVDMFIAPSRFLRQKLIGFGVPDEKIVYYDYGFNTQLFDNFKHNNSDKVRFGFLGRIIPVKGIDDLIRAFNRITADKAQLFIYGNNASSMEFLKKLSTNPNIFFENSYHNNDVAEILQDLDVLIIPSIWYENSPLVIHEAYLAGLPIITTDLGGMKELCDDGVTGYVFKRRDIDDLTEKIQKFIDDPRCLAMPIKNTIPVRNIAQDADDIEHLYYKLIRDN